MLHLIEKEPGMTQRLYANSLGTGGVLPSPTGAAGDVASIDDSWPLMCVGIGMTKHAIDALRSGALTKDVNKANSCMAVLHEFHHACFYCFLRLLTESPHLHHAVHLAAIRKEVSGDPRGMLRAFRNFKFPKPDNEGETHQKESSYDDIEEDRQESSGEIMGSKKSWFSGFGQSKASKFVVDAEK
ncbi:unnamed protein product [Symbiodinium microadriaticum]|nr:unnamed protein product [Symbiodinium microadriaticum]